MTDCMVFSRTNTQTKTTTCLDVAKDKLFQLQKAPKNLSLIVKQGLYRSEKPKHYQPSLTIRKKFDKPRATFILANYIF